MESLFLPSFGFLGEWWEFTFPPTVVTVGLGARFGEEDTVVLFLRTFVTFAKEAHTTQLGVVVALRGAAFSVSVGCGTTLRAEPFHLTFHHSTST